MGTFDDSFIEAGSKSSIFGIYSKHHEMTPFNSPVNRRKFARLGQKIQIQVDATWDKCVKREILGIRCGTKWEDQTSSYTHTAQSTHPKADIQPIIEDAKSAAKSALYK